MAEEEKKIIVDSDWKEQARREKEKLAQEAEKQAQRLPEPTLAELIDLIAVQAFAGLGLVAGPNGQSLPPNLGIAKHYIDLLQLLEDKTKGNLSDDEKKLLDRVLYQLRMTYVEINARGGAAPGAAPSPSGGSGGPAAPAGGRTPPKPSG